MHRGWIWLLSLIPIGILGGAVMLKIVWTKLPMEYPIRVVEINKSLSSEDLHEVTESLAQDMAKGFFGIDIENVQEGLKNIPWILQASVRRIWPDKIFVSIEEHVPLAYWGENGILSTEGTVFFPRDPKKFQGARLPYFNGPIERAKEMQQQYLVFLEMVAPLGLTIHALNLSDDGAWKMRLENGIDIVIGKSALTDRMARLVLAYPNIRNKYKENYQDIDRFDLRYTNGIAVGWKSNGQH